MEFHANSPRLRVDISRVRLVSRHNRGLLAVFPRLRKLPLWARLMNSALPGEKEETYGTLTPTLSREPWALLGAGSSD